ncbi:hypothetical protein O9929_00420 [Vibrio lentus]|nr:hypothetical protein [Vibrio lentus]
MAQSTKLRLRVIPMFNLEVPLALHDVDPAILDPRDTYTDPLCGKAKRKIWQSASSTTLISTQTTLKVSHWLPLVLNWTNPTICSGLAKANAQFKMIFFCSKPLF